MLEQQEENGCEVEMHWDESNLELQVHKYQQQSFRFKLQFYDKVKHVKHVIKRDKIVLVVYKTVEVSWPQLSARKDWAKAIDAKAIDAKAIDAKAIDAEAIDADAIDAKAIDADAIIR